MAAATELDALVHDATSVFRFVDFICQFCYQQENHQTYGEASKKFFRYIRDLGNCTREYIQADITDATADPSVVPIYRTNLATIKDCWARLHEFVKPVVDGHALQIPAPLLDFMERQLSELPRLIETKIVILISEELNYLQFQHSRLKDFAIDLSLTIPDAPQFPDKLALIGIPFSQRSTVFTNTLIYHELGHFAFEELQKRRDLNPAIEAALTASLATEYAKMSPKEKRWCQNQLASWAEETFCDLFAAWLIGPAYAFASIELLSLLNVLDEDNAKEFDSEHPCYAFRFFEQKEQLNSHGWWDAIKDAQCEHPKLIANMSTIPEGEYTSSPLESSRLIPAFLRLRSDIRQLVQSTVDNRDTGLKAFNKLRPEVEKCLSVGVVPSILFSKSDEPIHLVLINAAFMFYLESLPLLIEKIDGPGSKDLAHRSDISSRLEMWILKAVEDCNLLRRYYDGKGTP